MITWGRLRKSLRDARQKSVKRGTQHWSSKVDALLVWMDSASTSSDLISETGSIANSDLREVDLELAAVTDPTQVVEVSVHSDGSVEESPVIDASRALTMDNVIPAPLCPTLITCAHVLPLASTSNQLLCTSVSTPAPLLVTGPSFPPRTQGPISMIPGALIAFSGAPGAAVAPPAQYSTKQSAVVLPAPYSTIRAPEHRTAPHYNLLQACSGLVNRHFMLVHLWLPPAWPMYMPSNMPRPLQQPPFLQDQFEELTRQHQDIHVQELELQRMSQTINLNAVPDYGQLPLSYLNP